MRIKEEYKVREMAGEHIVVMQGRYGVDMTKSDCIERNLALVVEPVAGT